MIGDVRGYCTLKSTDECFIGVDEVHFPELYAEVKNSIMGAPMRIIDISVDKSGFLCLEPKGRCLVDVRSMESVDRYFLCNEIGGVVIPDCNDDVAKQMYEVTYRKIRLPSYGKWERAAVITKSLIEGKFMDSFLYEKQSNETCS